MEGAIVLAIWILQMVRDNAGVLFFIVLVGTGLAVTVWGMFRG